MLYQVAKKKAQDIATKRKCWVYVDAKLTKALHDGQMMPTVDHTAYTLTFWEQGCTVLAFGPDGKEYPR
jgi:hypothetical protein